MLREREANFSIPKKSNFVGMIGAAFTVSQTDGKDVPRYIAGFECPTDHTKVISTFMLWLIHVHWQLLQWMVAVGLNPDVKRAYVSKWADVCAAHSEDGLRWTR